MFHPPRKAETPQSPKKKQVYRGEGFWQVPQSTHLTEILNVGGSWLQAHARMLGATQFPSEASVSCHQLQMPHHKLRPFCMLLAALQQQTCVFDAGSTIRCHCPAY